MSLTCALLAGAAAAPWRAGLAQEEFEGIQRPEEVISLETINRLEAALDGDEPDYSDVAQAASQEITAYTSQFIEDKRILDQRRYEVYDPARQTANVARLIALARENRTAEHYFLSESPYLYRLHRILGEAYEGLDMPERALQSYAAAFRYTRLEVPPLSEIPEDANQDAQAMHDRQLQELYGWIATSFADPRRLAQIENVNERNEAERFRATLESYMENRLAYEEAQRQVFVVRDRVARGLGGSIADAEERRDQLEQQVQEERAILEETRTTSYADFARDKRARDADLAYHMALIVHRLETEEKLREREENRSSYERGLGEQPGINRTVMRDFAGYAIMLEFAHRLDPNNLRYLDLLAVEYRTSRRLERAIAFEEKFIELAREATPPPDDLAEHHRRLAGMYTDRQNYLKAADNYERYLELTDATEEEQLPAVIHLANIHFQKTGRFARARELFERYIDESNTNPDDLEPDARAEFYAQRFQISRNLASIHRRDRRSQAEGLALMAARASYAAIAADYTALQQERDGLQNELLAIKEDILYKSDPDVEERFYLLQRFQIPALEKQLSFLRARMDALPIEQILERQAWIAFQERRFRDAQEIYREVIRVGDGQSQVRARTNIERINASLASGYIRPPVLPANFER